MAQHGNVRVAKPVMQRSWLDKVGRFGNALPDPMFIFLAFVVLIVIVSVIADMRVGAPLTRLAANTW